MKSSMKETLKKEKTETVRTAILDAADSIIETEGFEKISIRKVAAMIGYSPGNIYQYFSDKDALINHTIMRGYMILMQSVKEGESVESDIPSLIETRFISYAEAVLRNPIYYKAVMFSGKETILEHTQILDRKAILDRPAFKELIESIREGIERKEIKEEDPVILAQILWSTVFGILTRGILESKGRKDILDMIIRVIHRVL